MKLLYTVILSFAVLKWVEAKPFRKFDVNRTLTPIEQFEKYYDDEINLQAKEICKKLNNISVEILNDESVKHNKSFLMQELKGNMTKFQDLYTFESRLGLFADLALDFSDMVHSYYHLNASADNEILYIMQLLRQLGYDDLRLKYKSEFGEFVAEKFLPKFKELNATISSKSNISKSDEDLIKWVNWLQECQEYDCFLINFDTFKLHKSTTLKRFFEELSREMLKAMMMVLGKGYNFAKALLEEPKLSQLSPALREKLKQNLQDIISVADKIDSVDELLFLPQIYNILLFQFENVTDIDLKERQLLTSIFNEHGYAEFFGITNNQRKNSREQQQETDYLTEYEKEKIFANDKKLTQFKEAITRLKVSATSEERVAAYESISKSLNKNLKE